MPVGDTLVANIAESTQSIIKAALMMLPQYSPTYNLVTRVEIPKGNNAADLPAIATFPTVSNPTEGDELVSTTQFDLTSISIAPVRRAMLVRVSARAIRFSKEQLTASISEWLARAQAVDVEQDLVGEFQNFNSANDLGGNTTDLALSLLRTARRLLDSTISANGGPAPVPISTVISPVAAEDLLANIGVQGVVASTSPWIPAGISEELVRQYALQGGNTFQLIGTGVYVSSAILNDLYGAASGGNAAAMFSKKSLYIAYSQDWDMKSFEESEWDGAILRTISDFNSGVGPYDRWGSFMLTDGT